MLRAGNELMKLVRERLDLNQSQLGEHLHMTQRTVSRIETGKRSLTLWEYFSLMEMAGKPTEDLSPLFLDSRELKDYNTYKELKGLIRDGRFSEIRDILPSLEKGLISKQPFITQFVAFVKIFVDEKMPPDDAINELYRTLAMSIKSFDKNRVMECRFTYNEIYILFAIAMKLESMGRVSCAIDLYKNLVESRGSALATDEDKAALFPALMFNLSNLLGKSGRYEEALKYCESAREICIKYNNLRYIPRILYNIACINRLTGEERQIYQTYFIRAYHVARAIGDKEFISITKSEAEKFGFTNL
jgi:tetratricopeptide (TPR) repeat protein